MFTSPMSLTMTAKRMPRRLAQDAVEQGGLAAAQISREQQYGNVYILVIVVIHGYAAYHKLLAIAPMGNKGGYTAKVRTSLPSALRRHLDEPRLYRKRMVRRRQVPGGQSEYPYIKTNWTGDNTDRYIRRHVTLTAEDLRSDLGLSIRTTTSARPTSTASRLST